ncbi:MAG: hypothetical protein O3C10_03355 [Chloroflexi bacterium]|nr:hypothetical protein [Chloroflexota bacterium]
MSEQVDANSLPDDIFGFRIYGVMAHLPEPQASQVRQLHTLIGADGLATRPHCSIDNFWGPDDLDAVKAALTEVASRHRPFETSVDFNDLRSNLRGAAYSLIPGRRS